MLVTHANLTDLLLVRFARATLLSVSILIASGCESDANAKLNAPAAAAVQLLMSLLIGFLKQ